jgi:hypothetical protein
MVQLLETQKNRPSVKEPQERHSNGRKTGELKRDCTDLGPRLNNSAYLIEQECATEVPVNYTVCWRRWREKRRRGKGRRRENKREREREKEHGRILNRECKCHHIFM